MGLAVPDTVMALIRHRRRREEEGDGPRSSGATSVSIRIGRALAAPGSVAVVAGRPRVLAVGVRHVAR